MDIHFEGDALFADGYEIASLSQKAPATVIEHFRHRIDGPDETSFAFMEALDDAVEARLDEILPELMAALLKRTKSKNTRDMIISVFEEYGG